MLDQNQYEGRGASGLVRDGRQSALKKYQSVVVGKPGWGAFLKYEISTCLFGLLPGALGIWCRGLFYPCLFGACGKNVVFGRDLTIRNPGRICLGSNIVLCDGVTLDAKGMEGEGIRINDGVFIGRGSVVVTIGGTIEIDEEANIGTYCRIATRSKTRVGKKVLFAAFCYLVGSDHESSRTDIAIVDQPAYSKGGVEVGDGCWLGTKATVLDGVCVGAHSIIGSHALVTNDLPAYAVAVGAPAKVIKMRK